MSSYDIKIIEKYIYTKKIQIKLDHIKNSCSKMYDFIKNNFVENNVHHSGEITLKMRLFNRYNLLMYPLPEFHELFTEIQDLFHTINPEKNKKYYLQCWLNYYNKGEFINWHKHWLPEKESWHGFYCVDVEDSHTSYKLPNNDNIIHIKSENNLLVINKSDGDSHKSSKWMYDDRPRITIAFDIVPREHIDYDKSFNHWIPI